MKNQRKYSKELKEEAIKMILSKTIKNIQNATEASNFTLNIYGEIQNEFGVLFDAFTEISNNSSELDAGGKKILDTREHLNQHSQRLKQESNELKTVNKEMVEVMGNLSEISYSIDSSIKEINNGMKGIAGGMEEMNLLSSSLDQSMASAEEHLNRLMLSLQ